jgi:hypothetical protein
MYSKDDPEEVANMAMIILHLGLKLSPSAKVMVLIDTPDSPEPIVLFSQITYHKAHQLLDELQKRSTDSRRSSLAAIASAMGSASNG